MNKVFTIVAFFICSVFFMHVATAQSVPKPTLEEIVYLLRNNKLDDFARYFDNFESVSINNNATNYSRNQAAQVLKDFFEKNPIRELNVMDTGSPNGNSKSMIATFTSSSGKYTLYVLIKLKDANYVVKEIKINKE